ncbi:alpha/beta fold hydrolase [Williamsia sp. CHRR-6]|uniref:alpha/beta fold hydrolase n=1 Tax=Williamsia sp. CHRR-6 TaxID=2835871 RepID=UPI001BDB5F02|nr:alpha/beta hydrolase [Williamsia sp. CHRR-6]MBT0567464.1 alpha/beta hydrolase [Williamsia sp. CHRR-6]
MSIADAPEKFVHVGDVRLAYQASGRDDDPTVVLIMGIGLDMLWWRDEFCDELIARRLRVVRFDNRDVGRSTIVEGPTPTLTQLLRRSAAPSYMLEDMGDDTAGLIHHVAPRGAHVVGVSLGSFIAQQAAIRHPDVVRSLVSIMGRPGDRRTGKSSWRYTREMLRAPKPDPVDEMVASFERIGSRGRTAADERDVRTIMPRSRARSGDRTDTGAGRQLAAIFAETDRTPGLRGLSMPALVIHGDIDYVITPSGGKATAAAIPGAELLMLEGMGHDLARRFWPDILDGIERTVRRRDPVPSAEHR